MITLSPALLISAGIVLLTVIGIGFGGTFLLRVGASEDGFPPPSRRPSSAPATPTPASW